jgi:hypothetical protein
VNLYTAEVNEIDIRHIYTAGMNELENKEPDFNQI